LQNRRAQQEYEDLMKDFGFVYEALNAQLPSPNPIFARRAVQELGPKLHTFAQDIRRKETTARTMQATWNKKNSLTMGYKSRSSSIGFDLELAADSEEDIN
jgi:tRNA A22 N-methylase